MRKSYILFLTLVLNLGFSCSRNNAQPQDPGIPDPPAGTTPLPASPQTANGDAAAGWDYLRYGGFIGGGLP